MNLNPDFSPTPDAELNALLHDLVRNAQRILGGHFVGAYLQGSFAIGDWDEDSDVDFLVVMEGDLSEAEISALQVLHGQLYDQPTHWAKHLDGSYFPKEYLAKEDVAHHELWYLDNTSRELIRSPHDNTLVLRWILRERGITLAGIDPHLLIDPVPTVNLRREVLARMKWWADEVFRDPPELDNGWYQPYAVLSFCRMLKTLQSGAVVSKLAGARWAQTTLDERWRDLIEHAWQQRPDPTSKARQKADPADFAITLEFLRYALEYADQMREGYAPSAPNH